MHINWVEPVFLLFLTWFLGSTPKSHGQFCPPVLLATLRPCVRTSYLRHYWGRKNFIEKVAFFDQTCPRIAQMSDLIFRTLCSLSSSVQMFLHGVLWSKWGRFEITCSLENLVFQRFVIPQFLNTNHFTLNKCMPTVGCTRCYIPNVTNCEFGRDVVNCIDLCIEALWQALHEVRSWSASFLIPSVTYYDEWK